MGGANGKKKKSPRGGKKQSATEKSTAARRSEEGHEGKDKMSEKRNNDSEAASASALETQIETALTHISYDRIEQGLKELKDICSKNPSSIDALETYAYALAEYGDQEDALYVSRAIIGRRESGDGVHEKRPRIVRGANEERGRFRGG